MDVCYGQRFEASPGLAALGPSPPTEAPALFSEVSQKERQGQGSEVKHQHVTSSPRFRSQLVVLQV